MKIVNRINKHLTKASWNQTFASSNIQMIKSACLAVAISFALYFNSKELYMLIALILYIITVIVDLIYRNETKKGEIYDNLKKELKELKDGKILVEKKLTLNEENKLTLNEEIKNLKKEVELETINQKKKREERINTAIK